MVSLTGVFAAVFGWYRGPMDQLEGRFGPNAYDFEGLSLPACTLFAFGVGTLVGVLVHRTLAAMAITVGVYLAIRVPAETWLRPHLQPPLQIVTAAGQPQSGARGDWTLANGLTDSHATRLSDTAEAAVLRTARTAGGPQQDYLTAHGYGHWALIQPANRFWHFQLLEAGLYLTLATACLTAAVLILRRRPS